MEKYINAMIRSILIISEQAEEISKIKLIPDKTLRKIEYAAFNSFLQDMAGMKKKARFYRLRGERKTLQENLLAGELLILEKREERNSNGSSATLLKDIHTKTAMRLEVGRYNGIYIYQLF